MMVRRRRRRRRMRMTTTTTTYKNPEIPDFLLRGSVFR
jgi:hypothetical protein